MQEKLNKFKEESKKLGVSESVVMLLRKFQSMYDELSFMVARNSKHMCMSCETVSTIGGSTTEEFLDSSIKVSMHCTVTMAKLGSSPVSILSAKCGTGKIVFKEQKKCLLLK